MASEIIEVQEQEEEEEEEEEEKPCTINTQAQRDKIRGIIEYQKSLYFSSSSSASASTSASCSFSSSRKSSSLLELMKEGSTCLRRLFDMEHTSLATHWKDYAGSPVIKPILLWGSDDDEVRIYDDPWIGIKKTVVDHSQSGDGQSGLTVFNDGEFEGSRMGKNRLTRTKSFRRLPRFRKWRFRGFRLRLKRPRIMIMICGRKF